MQDTIPSAGEQTEQMRKLRLEPNSFLISGLHSCTDRVCASLCKVTCPCLIFCWEIMALGLLRHQAEAAASHYMQGLTPSYSDSGSNSTQIDLHQQHTPDPKPTQEKRNKRGPKGQGASLMPTHALRRVACSVGVACRGVAYPWGFDFGPYLVDVCQGDIQVGGQTKGLVARETTAAQESAEVHELTALDADVAVLGVHGIAVQQHEAGKDARDALAEEHLPIWRDLEVHVWYCDVMKLRLPRKKTKLG